MFDTGKHLSELCPADDLSSLPRRRSRVRLLLPYNRAERNKAHLGPSLVSVDSTQGSTKTALERACFSSLSAARGAPRWKGSYLWLPKLAGYSPCRFTDNSFDLTLWHFRGFLLDAGLAVGRGKIQVCRYRAYCL